MGIIIDIKTRLEKIKQNRINQKTIQKVLKELGKIDSDDTTTDNAKKERRQNVIKNFELLVENGSVKIDSNETAESLGVVEKVLGEQYPSISQIAKEIRFFRMFDEIEKEMSECIAYKGTHADRYEKIEKLALDFYKKYPEDEKRDFQIKPLSIVEIHNIIKRYLREGLTNGRTTFLEEAEKRLDILTRNKVIENINKAPNKKEQERIYSEFIRDFLNGIENPKDSVVQYFQNSEFIQERNRKSLCEKYDVKYNKMPLIIYEATEDKLHELNVVNRERAIERQNEVASISELVLVRTTNVYPKNGVVEVLDKHSTPELEASFFKQELREQGIDENDFKLYSFVNRRTSHWTLNGLVASHAYGDFSGRNFIIVEPYEEQANNDGVVSIDESDTYFEGDLRLSSKAIILMRLEEYKERYKSPEKRKEMENMNIRLFVGDEKIAVKMLLQDLGYVYEEIGTWGYDLDENTPELKYARKLETIMENEKTRLIAAGKNIDSTTHFYSKSRNKDLQRMSQLENEKMDKFIELLAEETGINFSPKYLKRVFLNRNAFKNDDDDHYLDRDIQEPEGLEKMGPKEIFDKIGIDKLKQITKKFNEMILQEHSEARKQKDEELRKKGWVRDEIGTKLEIAD